MGKRFLLLVAILIPAAAWAQSEVTVTADHVLAHPEVGLPFISEHYAPQEYEHQPSNWDVVQDQRGIIYVANNDGILQFDGAAWRLIPTVTNTIVRSLAVGPEGRVYAGAQGDFGYLEPDSTGSFHYISLIGEVAEADRDFKDVWETHATSEGVYFQTRNRVFFWDGEEMQVWRPDDGVFHTSFVVRDEFYVREHEKGLLKRAADALRLVSNGERFAEDNIFAMLPYPDDRVLAITRDDGAFLFDGQNFDSFATEVEAYLAKHSLYDGSVLPGNLFALATKSGGVAIINEQGQRVQILDKSVGLPDKVVNAVFADRQGGLWMAFNNSGVMRSDVYAPLSVYDERSGLDGVVWDVERHQGMLYAATGAGLFVLGGAPGPTSVQQRPEFRHIAGIPLPLGLTSTDHGLLVATDNGVYQIQDGDSKKLTSRQALVLKASDTYEERVYVGQENGVVVLQHSGVSWEVAETRKMRAAVKAIVEGEDGRLWVSTKHGNVFRIRTSDGVTMVRSFGVSGGLPDSYLTIGSLGNEIVALSKTEGVFRLADTGRGVHFYPDTTLIPPASSMDSLLSFSSTGTGDAWLVYPDHITIARRQPDGTYRHESPPALRFSRSARQQRSFLEENGVAWIANQDQLIRYDPRVPGGEVSRFPPLVRRITTLDGARVVYGGVRTEKLSGPEGQLPQIEYDFNDLKVEYARPEFNPIVETTYQYYLEGESDGWSKWTPSTVQTFTNLDGGSYTFRVRARTAGGVLGREASFSFRILPPWYLTWQAYGVYTLFLVLGVFGLRHYRRVLAESRQVKEQARELARERRVKRRLQEANESLRQANEYKEELLAMTSHELRTPVTAILGFTSILEDELPGHYQEFLGYIALNGRRLQETVDSLLDLAKLRSGMMTVDSERLDLNEETQEAVQMYRPLAEQKGLALQTVRPERPIYVELDRTHLERVLNNLIDNAIKFTEEGGITVEVERDEKHARIKVTDTGVGINESFIPHLFEEFKQESTGTTRSHEGSGLGLTITARLISLMGGEISVESTKGLGTTFVVSFPVSEVRSRIPILV